MTRATRARIITVENRAEPVLAIRAIDGQMLLLDGFVPGEEVVIVRAKEWDALGTASSYAAAHDLVSDDAAPRDATFRGTVSLQVRRSGRHWRVVAYIDCGPHGTNIALGGSYDTQADAEGSLEAHAKAVVAALDQIGVKHDYTPARAE